jgi:outer membrane protein W
LPLQVTYFFGKFGDRVRPKVYAGPSVAVRVAEQQFYDGDDLNLDEDLFSRADFGITAGVGANFRLSRLTWLNVDAGYYHGFVDVIPNANDFNGNRNLRLNVGLMWGL